MAYDNTNPNDFERDSHRKYFLPRVNITKYYVLINGKNFYDQPITHETRKYDEVKMISLRKGEDYTIGCLLDYKYLKDHYQLIACDLSKQKDLDADPRAIQQLEFNFMLDTNALILTVLEKSKETIFEFSRGKTRIM